jgi:hypothetical protein
MAEELHETYKIELTKCLTNGQQRSPANGRPVTPQHTGRAEQRLTGGKASNPNAILVGAQRSHNTNTIQGFSHYFGF